MITPIGNTGEIMACIFGSKKKGIETRALVELCLLGVLLTHRLHKKHYSGINTTAAKSKTSVATVNYPQEYKSV
jgi:hypothetical protein